MQKRFAFWYKMLAMRRRQITEFHAPGEVPDLQGFTCVWRNVSER
jgi:hypothetical protein